MCIRSTMVVVRLSSYGVIAVRFFLVLIRLLFLVVSFRSS